MLNTWMLNEELYTILVFRPGLWVEQLVQWHQVESSGAAVAATALPSTPFLAASAFSGSPYTVCVPVKWQGSGWMRPYHTSAG